MAAKDLVYFVSGMWCSTCAKSIGESVSRLEGVASAQVNYATKLLLVRPLAPDTEQTLDPSIQQKVTQIGFGIKKQSEGWLMHFHDELKNESHQKITWVQVSIVWFLAMWSSMLALSSYMGGVTDAEVYYLSMASSAFGLPAIVIGGIPYARSGLRALRHSHLLTLDLFIFLGAISSFGISAYSLLKGSAETYADSGSMILAILLLTKKIENSVIANITSKILFQLHPKQDHVLVFRKEKWVEASVSQVKKNDLIQIQENETIPLDGTLESDSSVINNHLMNGENLKISLKRGDDLFAGAIACSPALVRVVAPQGQRKIDQWAEKALLAENSKGRLQSLFSKVESGLVVLAFSGALLIAVVRAFGGGSASSIVQSFFIGILIFCPCLFASILPLTKQIAHLALLKAGVMSSRIEALLDLSGIRNFYFDKTGTLEAVESYYLAFENGEAAVPFLNELAVRSGHSILRGLQSRGETAPIESIEEIPGEGLHGVAQDGTRIVVGRASFLNRMGIPTQSKTDSASSLVALNGVLVGEIIKKQVYDQKSKLFLQKLLHLSRSGHIAILSGDPQPGAGEIYSALNARIQYHGNLSPEDKVRLIEPNSMYIGDGLNDTMALAKARVSFRIGHRVSGLSPVDFQLQRPDLDLILQVHQYSKKYKRILIQTGMSALLYNIVAISLAVLGKFSPLGAVVAMALSFSVMLLSTFRLSNLEAIK